MKSLSRIGQWFGMRRVARNQAEAAKNSGNGTPIPAFMNLQPLSLKRRTVVPFLEFVIKGPPEASLCGFEMQKSMMTNWCWAAVASSVSLFYDVNHMSQRAIVDCSQCNRPDCNCTGKLEKSLEKVGHLRPPILGRVDFHTIQSEIKFECNSAGLVDSQRPVCCRIKWALVKGHYIAIVGWLYDGKEQHIRIADPAFVVGVGNSCSSTGKLIPFDVFCKGRYRNQLMSWENTFLTKRA